MPEDLSAQLKTHLEATRNALTSYRDRWSTYIRLYKAQRKSDVKNFPWPGCSNIFMPELHAEVNTIAANIFGSTIRQDPPFLVRAFRREEPYISRAEVLEHFLTFYTKKVQRLDSYWLRSLPYLVLLGTHVTKLSFREFGNLGFPEVKLTPIPLHHIYIYPGVKDPTSSTFVADLSWVPLSTLYEWHKRGLITRATFDTLRQQAAVSSPKTDPFSENRTIPSSIPGDHIPIYDCYMTYYDENGKPKRVRAVYEEFTNTVLWTEPWGDQLPYIFINYKQDEDSVFGIGLADLTWTLQEAINTGYNQAIDNATIANVRMVVAPPGSNIEPGDPVYPGRVIISPAADKIRPWPVGDVYPSALGIPQLVRNAMERVAATSESLMGMSDSIAKTRATFAGAALNVQMGVTRLDMSSAEFENGLIETVWRTLAMLAEYSRGTSLSFPLTRAENATIEQGVLDIAEDIATRSTYDIQPARRTANQQIERQAAILLSQLVNGYLERTLQFGLLVAQNPNVQPLVGELWSAANEAMKRVLRSFSVENPERIIVELSEALNANQQPLGPSGVPGEEEPGVAAAVSGGLEPGPAPLPASPVQNVPGTPEPGEELLNSLDIT